MLELIDELVREHGMGLILISHDLALVARFCDRIMVMAAGEVVETCDARPAVAGAPPLYPRPDRRGAADERDARVAAGARPRRTGRHVIALTGLSHRL